MEKADALLIDCPNCGAKNRVEKPRHQQFHFAQRQASGDGVK